MSIASEIQRIKDHIAAAYTACETKGASMPEKLNAENLAKCILSLIGERIPYISYKGTTTTALSPARRYIASTSTENHVIFGGGVNGGNSTSTGSTAVEAYDKDLVKTTMTALSVGRRLLQAGSNSKYSLFVGGGKTSETSTYVDTVDAYDRDLVKVTAPAMSTQRYMWNNTCIRAGEHIMVAGGVNKAGKNNATIDTFDIDLVLTTLNDPEYQIAPGGGLTFYDKAFFAGGIDAANVLTKRIAIYDEDLVRIGENSLTDAKAGCFGVTNKNLAIFAGGINGSTSSGIVDMFDKDYVATTRNDLLVARNRGGSASSEYYGVIAGGAYKTDEAYDTGVTEAFTTDGAKIVLRDLTVARRYLAGGYIDGKFLFGGGQKGSSTAPQSVVNVYELV